MSDPRVVGERLFARRSGDMALVELDPHSGQVRRELSRPGDESAMQQLIVDGSTEDLLIGEAMGGQVVALDGQSYEERFRFMCADTESSCRLGFARVGELLIAAGMTMVNNPAFDSQAFAIDVRSGREVWRTDLPTLNWLNERVAVEGDHVHLIGVGQMITLDAQSGRIVRETSDARLDGFAELTRFADTTWVQSSRLMRIEDGQLETMHPRGVAYASTDEETLFIASGSAIGAIGPGAYPLVNISSGGHVRHLVAFEGAPITTREWTRFDAPRALVSVHDGPAHITWSRAFESVDTLERVGDHLLVEADSELFAFVESAAAELPEQAHIEGNLRSEDGFDVAGVAVCAGAARTSTDEHGRFELEVEGYGGVMVRLCDAPERANGAPWDPSRPVVQVDSLRSHFEVDILVNRAAPWPPC